MTPKTSKILMYVSISVLAAVIAAAGFTQTTLFRKTLRATLYKLVESNLNASVYFGEIRGNIFTGFSVDTVAMYVNNASFVEARNVVVSYDPLPLWYKRVSVASLEIENPSISLIRFADGTWNVDRLHTCRAIGLESSGANVIDRQQQSLATILGLQDYTAGLRQKIFFN